MRDAGCVSGVRPDVADHGVRVPAFGVQVRVGVVFRDKPQAVLLVQKTDQPGQSRRKQVIREASPGEGRMVMRVSSADPGPCGAPAVVSVDAPVPQAGDRRHHIESVRAAAIARLTAPRASGVFNFDQEVVLVGFGTQGERAAVGGRRCAGPRWWRTPRRPGPPRRPAGSRPAIRRVRPARARPAGVRRGRFRCDGGCPPPRLSWSLSLSLCLDLCFTACRARATVGNGIGPDAH